MNFHFLRLRDLRDPDLTKSKLSYGGRRSRRLCKILTFPLQEDRASLTHALLCRSSDFFFSSADWLYPYGRVPGGWRLQTSAYDVATREGDLKNFRHRSSQLQMGTCQGHLPSASSRDWALFCCSCWPSTHPEGSSAWRVRHSAPRKLVEQVFR